ncbi:MAG: hypothetical protein E7228_02090 [Clostridiales bacterium]|nr:hypothetical protein [Clostridiales bacterium]
MKKALCLLLAGVTAFSLSACGMPEFDSSNLTEAQAYTFAIFEKETVADYRYFKTAEVMLTDDFKADMEGIIEINEWDTSDISAAVLVDYRYSSGEVLSDSILFLMDSEKNILNKVVVEREGRSDDNKGEDVSPEADAATEAEGVSEDFAADDTDLRTLAEKELELEDYVAQNAEALSAYDTDVQKKLAADPNYIYSEEYINGMGVDGKKLIYDDKLREVVKYQHRVDVLNSGAANAKDILDEDEALAEMKTEICKNYYRVQREMAEAESQHGAELSGLIAKAEEVKKNDPDYLYNPDYISAAVGSAVLEEYDDDLLHKELYEEQLAYIDKGLETSLVELKELYQDCDDVKDAKLEYAQKLRGYAKQEKALNDFNNTNAAALKAYEDESAAAKKAAGSNYEKDVDYIKVQIKYEDLLNDQKAHELLLQEHKTLVDESKTEKDEEVKAFEDEEKLLINDAAAEIEIQGLIDYLSTKEDSKVSEYDAAKGEWGYIHPEYADYQNENLKRPVKKSSSSGGSYKYNYGGSSDDGGVKYDPNDDLYREHDYNNDGKINDQEFQDALGDYMDELMGY